MPAPQTTGSYTPRLRATAQYVRDCRERYRNALAARNALVVAAVDAVCGNRTVARACGLAESHVVRILSNSDPESTAA